tara:strand:- start:37 stop:996 length:960 start_codon:yes stop_codon:yes gene_type:complete
MIYNILIIGRTPPPIGGVSIHTSRLLDLCEELNIKYEFYDLQKFNLITFLKAILFSNKSHLHANNPILLFLYSLICFLLQKHSIITIHGNLGTYNYFLTYFEKLSLRLCTTPITLNNYSFETAKKLNVNTRKLSAFIPPIKTIALSYEYLNKINSTGSKENTLFCTNAYDYVFDKEGNEIYGIFSLVDYFNKSPNKRLVISDPKGSYFSYSKNNNIKIEKNIVFLTGDHSFFEVLKLANCFIRNTSTDGDSLSVKEALFLGVSVIATNCVDRPPGVTLIKCKNSWSLENAINKIKFNIVIKQNIQPINCGIEIIDLYRN